MKITLSIVSHGQRDIALRMLEDILRLSPPDVAEIIYTANIPERDLPALNMGHIRLVVIRNETPKGFGSNHNTAFSHCRTPYFCVMNPDLRFDADPFPALLQDLTGTPKRGLVAPRIYSPEGELALGQAVIYLAMAAKSNAGYMAYNQAAAFVKKDKSRPVPVHLRNAPTKLMKELGYGHAYRYAHDEPNAYAAGETYLPEGMREPGWYKPVQRGLELKIGEKLTQLRTWDAEARRRERSKAKGAMPPDDAMPNQERQ